MNKKLVAVAVAGLLAAPLAAEAQTANVTLYGRLNLTMEAVSGRQLQQADRSVGTCNDEAASLVFDVAGGGLQHVRGNLLATFDHEL